MTETYTCTCTCIYMYAPSSQLQTTYMCILTRSPFDEYFLSSRYTRNWGISRNSNNIVCNLCKVSYVQGSERNAACNQYIYTVSQEPVSVLLSAMTKRLRDEGGKSMTFHSKLKLAPPHTHTHTHARTHTHAHTHAHMHAHPHTQKTLIYSTMFLY